MIKSVNQSFIHIIFQNLWDYSLHSIHPNNNNLMLLRSVDVHHYANFPVYLPFSVVQMLHSYILFLFVGGTPSEVTCDSYL